MTVSPILENAAGRLKTTSTLNSVFKHISTCTFLVIAFATAGQELYDHRLDENKWNDIRRNIRYENQPDGPGRQWTYESQQEYESEREKHSTGSNQNGSGSGNDGASEYTEDEDYSQSAPPKSDMTVSKGTFQGLGVIGYILLIAFAGLLIWLIYYLFINAPGKGKKIEPVNLDDQAPSEIPLTELQRLLQEALSRGDFRGAIRIYFIFIIRDLSQKNWIRWEKDKTNFQYLREMSDKTEYPDFNKSVSYFEIIWYGKRDIDKDTFEKIKPEFTRLLDKLGVQ